MAVIPDNDATAGLAGMPAPFACDISYLGDHAAVTVRGELDVATSSALLRELQPVLVQPMTRITMNLADLTFLDSSGVRTLLTIQSAATEAEIEFTLASVRSQARRVLEVTGLTDRFAITW